MNQVKQYRNSFIAKPLSYVAIDQKATIFLSKHDPNALKNKVPVDIERILTFTISEELNYKILIDPSMNAKEIQGQTNFFEKRITLPEAVYNGLLNDRGPDRFTAAHEIGHIDLHADYVLNTGTMHKSNALTEPYRDSEWQANCFAGCLLLPREQIKDIASNYKGDLKSLVQSIASAYKVSLATAFRRLAFLEKFYKIKTGASITSYEKLFHIRPTL